MDPMFRQRLRNHHRDLTVQYQAAEPGTRAWFKLDAAIRATEAVHVELYREPVVKVHSQPPFKPS